MCTCTWLAGLGGTFTHTHTNTTRCTRAHKHIHPVAHVEHARYVELGVVMIKVPFLGFRVWVLCYVFFGISTLHAHASWGFRVECLGFRVSGLELSVQGLGLRVWILVFRFSV